MAYNGNRSRRSSGGKKDNVLFLSVNEEPQSDRSPDYKGSGVVDGVEYWLGGWSKENDYGEYIQISLTPKDESSRSGGRGRDDRGRGRQRDDRGGRGRDDRGGRGRDDRGGRGRDDRGPRRDRDDRDRAPRDDRGDPPVDGDFDDDIPF